MVDAVFDFVIGHFNTVTYIILMMIGLFKALRVEGMKTTSNRDALAGRMRGQPDAVTQDVFRKFLYILWIHF